MKPYADKQWEGFFENLTACLLKNEPATYREWRVKDVNPEPKRKRV